MKVVWLPETKRDIERLYRFLLAKSPRAAERAVGAIQDGAELLRSQPEMGRPMDDEMERRELFVPFGAGAYVLRYVFQEGVVVILRVWHSREAR